jgi:hypothetical protein
MSTEMLLDAKNKFAKGIFHVMSYLSITNELLDFITVNFIRMATEQVCFILATPNDFTATDKQKCEFLFHVRSMSDCYSFVNRFYEIVA